MRVLSNKVVVFTDLHFGIHSNSQSYIDICRETLGWIAKYCSKHKIGDVIFMGDFFDSRASIDVKTLNSATESLYALVDGGINVTMILGNHDIYLRDSTSIHSLLAFGGHKGIRLVDEAEAVGICGSEDVVLLLPWLYGTTTKRVDVPRGTKYVFSHHNFPVNYFMGGAVNRKKTHSDSYTSKTPYEDEYGIQQDVLESVVKNGGLFFSGHIHHRKEIPLKNSAKMIIEGSPYETSWGFNDVDCGAYVVDFNECSYTFLPNPHNKKHVEIRTSNAEEDMENVDFGNSIVRLNVDTQESFDTISKLQSKINLMKPFSVENTKYEFTVAEFVGNNTNDGGNVIESICGTVSSKLDYVLNAIERGDFSAFSFMNSEGISTPIDKGRLKAMARELFERKGKVR